MKKVLRRLRSTRGTAYLEFAVLVPLFLFMFFFAADFTRILYCEQQVEIASRALCDIECHLRPGDRDKKGQGEGSGCPAWHGKRAVRRYLAGALAKEGLYPYYGDVENSVYCKAKFYRQGGPIHWLAFKLLDLLTPQSDGNVFIRMLQSVFGGVVNLLTMRTFRYVQEVLPTDKVVKASVSVLIQPVMPKGCYTLFGRHDSEGVMLIPAAAPRIGSGHDLTAGQRVRYYCHMPSFDTAPLAPSTYARQLSKIYPKSWFDWK